MQNFSQGMGIGQVIQQNVQAKAAAEAEASRKQAQQESIDSAMNGGGIKDWINASRNATEQELKNISQMQETWSLDQKERAVAAAVSMISALENNQPEIVKARLTEQAAALRNEGDEEKARLMEGFITQLDDPKTAEAIKGYLIQSNMGLPGFEEALTNMETYTDTQGKEQKQETDLFEIRQKYSLTDGETALAKRVADDFGHEAIRTMLEYPQVSNTEGASAITPTNILSYAKNYSDEREPYLNVLQKANDLYALSDSIEARGTDSTGADDEAIIKRFNQIFDDSVIRNSEFEQTKKSQGIIDVAKNYIASLKQGSVLGKKGRDAIVAAVKILEGTANQNFALLQDQQDKLITAGLHQDLSDIIISDRINRGETPDVAEKPAAPEVFTQVGDYRVVNPGSVQVVRFLTTNYPGLIDESDRKLIESGASEAEILANWDKKYGIEFNTQQDAGTSVRN